MVMLRHCGMKIFSAICTATVGGAAKQLPHDRVASWQTRIMGMLHHGDVTALRHENILRHLDSRLFLSMLRLQ